MPDNNNTATSTEKLLTSGIAPLLCNGLTGIEKESLRVDPAGHIARTPHPHALGSPLTWPNVTTDYSEALIELVTEPFARATDTLDSLADIHSFVYQHLGDETLWATSMPCALEADERIPIANYGTSNVGMMKHVYRRGLGWRYGRTMQTISGVHCNYSIPTEFWPAWQQFRGDRGPLRAFTDAAYFGMLRNFQRLGWLVPYFFGASPAVCKSFFHGRDVPFREFDAHTYFEPYATSLRMSDIGYKNKNKARIRVSYNGLSDYVRTLTHATSTPEPQYQAIGVKVNGEYRQLNANILQIENEFYTYIRPKQPIRSGERAALALRDRGVLYAEVRALDVNAYEPVGVAADALRFIEALLILCLLLESPPISADEQAAINHNQTVAARHGRDPALQLERDATSVSLRDWAGEVLTRLAGICEVLDRGSESRAFAASLAARRAALTDPERLPSARVLADMRSRHESFFEFGARLSREHREFFKTRRLTPGVQAEFARHARESLEKQAQIEAADHLSFDDYLAWYFSQT
ncbi:MAG: glutamate--cysteine ligase [Gammaproteobacteria bacterium]